MPKSRLQAKYAVLTWARLPSATVAIAQRFEASSSDRATDASRRLATGLLDRSIARSPRRVTVKA